MNTTTEKWRQTGLLENIEDEQQCNELALALEDMVQRLYKDVPPCTPESQEFASMIIPIVRRLYEVIKPLPSTEWIHNDFKQFCVKYQQFKEDLEDLKKTSVMTIDHEAEFVAFYIEHTIKKYIIPSIPTNPNLFIGMTLDDAQKSNTGWFVEPSSIDGKNIPISSSLCTRRVCVAVENNKIVGITSKPDDIFSTFI